MGSTMGGARHIAARLIAAACSPRRAQSRVAPLAAAAVPTGLVENALMLVDAVSAALSEGAGGAGDELVCFVHSQSPMTPDASSSSSSSFPFLLHPRPSHPSF